MRAIEGTGAGGRIGAGSAGLAVPLGFAVAALQFAGSIKALPWALPLDPTPPLLACALLLGMARLVAIGPPASGSIGLLFGSLGALGAWFTVSASWSPGPVVAEAKLLELVLLGPVAAGLGVLVGSDERALRAFGQCAGGIAVGLALAIGIWPPWSGGSWGLEALRAGYQHANHVFAVGAGALAASAVVAGGSRTARYGAVAGTVLLTLAALATGGRAGFVALAVAVTIAPAVALMRAGKPGAAVLAVLLPALVLGAALLLILADPASARAWRTVARFLEGDLGESSARLPLWRAALDLARRSLPVGLGVGGFPPAAGFGELRRMWPHNHAIEALAEGGVPGLLLLLLAWGAAIAGVVRGRRVLGPQALAVAVTQGLVQLLLILVSTDLGNRQAWLAAGILAGAGAARRTGKDSRQVA